MERPTLETFLTTKIWEYIEKIGDLLGDNSLELGHIATCHSAPCWIIPNMGRSHPSRYVTLIQLRFVYWYTDRLSLTVPKSFVGVLWIKSLTKSCVGACASFILTVYHIWCHCYRVKKLARQTSKPVSAAFKKKYTSLAPTKYRKVCWTEWKNHLVSDPNHSGI